MSRWNQASSRCRRLWLIAIVVALPAQAQQLVSKRALTDADYARWDSTIGLDAALSPNGKYLAYSYGQWGRSMLVLESTDGKYRQELPGGSRATFTADNRRFVLQRADSAVLLELATRRTMSAPNGIVSRRGRWLTSQQDTVLVVTDLYTARERRYVLSGDRAFVPSETALVISAADSLVWIDLVTGRAMTVHRGPRASELAFDTTGTRIAFVTGDSTDRVVRAYQVGMDTARAQVGARSAGMRPGATIAPDAPWFSLDGAQLYFRTVERAPTPPSDSLLIAKTVDVWHYRDRSLQSYQLVESGAFDPFRTAGYAVVVAMAGGPVIPLESRDTVLAGTPGKRLIRCDFTM